MVFANNTILLHFFPSFFLIIGLYILIAVPVRKMFHPTTELIIPIGILTREAKAEMESTADANISKYSM